MKFKPIGSSEARELRRALFPTPEAEFYDQDVDQSGAIARTSAAAYGTAGLLLSRPDGTVVCQVVAKRIETTETASASRPMTTIELVAFAVPVIEVTK